MIYRAIEDERMRQNAKWGPQDHDDPKWLAIVTEELGEVAKEVNELTPAAGPMSAPGKILEINLRKELIQTAASCVAWLEAIDRRRNE